MTPAAAFKSGDRPGFVSVEGPVGVPWTAPPPQGAAIWRLGFGASVLLHAVAVAAILFHRVWPEPPSKPADSVMTVELAPTPSAPARPPRQTPPGPQRIESRPRSTPTDQPRIPLPPELATPLNPEVVLQAKTDPKPDRPMQKQNAEQTTAPLAVAAPPKPDVAAPTSGASTSASNAPQSWESSVLAKLQRNKRYPGQAQSQGQEDVVYVRIAIDRSGRLINADVVRSRGYALLDNEVLALVHRASPFPMPPAEENGNPVIVVVPVEFFISSRR